jgi:uncharacterized membrane protein YhaH (DUF805 family)
MRMLFSFRGRITRTEYFSVVVSWLSVFVIVAAASKSAPSLGYPWAAWIVAVVMLSGMFSMLGLMMQRARDSGRGFLSAVLNPFTLFRRGTAGPNAYGAPPPRGRVWWFLGAAVLLGGLAYIAAVSTFDRIAAPRCTPVVSASAATLAEAERRWREGIIATHGANYLEGMAIGGRTVCRDGMCTFSASACRRISRNP